MKRLVTYIFVIFFISSNFSTYNTFELIQEQKIEVVETSIENSVDEKEFDEFFFIQLNSSNYHFLIKRNLFKHTSTNSNPQFITLEKPPQQTL